MNNQSRLDERSIYSSDEQIQKLKDRRDSLAKHYHELKTSREASSETNDHVKGRRYRFGKMKRSKSIEPSTRRQSSNSTNDSTSSHTILIKAISQLLEKKKEEQERSSYSFDLGRSDSKEAYKGIPHGRSSMIYEDKPIPRRCRSVDPSERHKMEEDAVPSIVSSRPTNVSINKAIMQLLEKKQSMDMSISQELSRIQRSKATTSLMLAGYLRKAVPSKIGEWVTMYVQVQPGLLTMSDCYGRSKQKIILSTSIVKCRAVKVQDNVMKILSKAGENINEVSFFEIKSVGGISRLWMTNTSVERDAWLAAIEEATVEDESLSDLSSSELML